MSRALLTLFFLLPALSSHAFEQVNFKAEYFLPKEVRPAGITIDEEGSVFIADRAGKGVLVLGPDGKITGGWGGSGLKEPSGISFFEGKLFITDSEENRVLVFSKNGSLVEGFGRKGKGPKEFSSPRGIHAGEGILHVADTGNHRVQMLGTDGIYMKEYGGKGDGPLQMNTPTDVAVDPRGNIFVTDTKNNRVQSIKPSGQLIRNYTALEKPEYIWMEEDGFLVSGRDQRVKKIGFGGNTMLSFGQEGTGRGQFKDIAGIASDSEGNIYVLDAYKNSIQVFQTEKRMSAALAEYAPPPTFVRWNSEIQTDAQNLLWHDGLLYAVNRQDKSIMLIKEGAVVDALKAAKEPKGMDFDPEGFLWVADYARDSALKLGRGGEVVLEIKGYFSDPVDIAISKKGIIFVADSGGGKIQAFNTEGIFVSEMGRLNGRQLLRSPIALALDSLDNLYVADYSGHAVFIFTSDGRPVMKIGGEKSGEQGLFSYPTGICVSMNEIFVLDSGNRRVQVFDRQGKYLRSFGAKGSEKGDFLEPVSIALKGNNTLFISDGGNRKIQVFDIVYTPSAPLNLKAEGGMREIVLSWGKGVENFIDRYRIYKSEHEKIGYVVVAETQANSYADAGVSPEINYYYKVSAVATEGNESRKSRPAKAAASKYRLPQASGLTVKAEEGRVSLGWEPMDDEYLSHYAVYREENGITKIIGNSETPSYTDYAVRPNTAYTYMVSGVSTDGIEGDYSHAKVQTLTETRPPIEIEIIGSRDVFSNNYKIYETEDVISVKLTNNTWDDISSLRVSFFVKEFMDFPTEKEFAGIKAGQSISAGLNAVFSRNILDITENTPIQAEVKVQYYENQIIRTFTKNQTLTVHEKHHLTWDKREKIATFVTPKDPVVLEFSRQVAMQYKDMAEPLYYARALFEALGVMGVLYMPDPNNPYQRTSENVDFVDYIQYPRETLKRKSGDCDDLASLYSAMLESLGMNTALLDYPGHILMMFSTGAEAEQNASYGNYIVHGGYLWAPVEVTLLGGSFINAWKKGMESYHKWKDTGLGVFETRESWKTYKPATLPEEPWRPEQITRKAIEARFGGELQTLREHRIKYMSKRYQDIFSGDSIDAGKMLQLGIIYGENGETKGAMEIFRRILIHEPTNAAAINNMGNIHFIEGRHREAKDSYEESLRIEPGDPHVLMNLARCQLRLKMFKEARKAVGDAALLEPGIINKYPDVAFELEGAAKW